LGIAASENQIAYRFSAPQLCSPVEVENCAALALVASTGRFELSDRTKLLELMHKTAQRISSGVVEFSLQI